MSSHKQGPGAVEHWSDGETSALLDAWGPLYLQRNRGKLSSEDWRVVNSAVSSHRAAAGRSFNRSRVQCQNRAYSLKCQYKRELLNQGPSRWRHFSQLRAFLASPDDPPPGFSAKMPAVEVIGGDNPPPGFPAKMPASVNKGEEAEVEVIGGASGPIGRSAIPTARHFSSLLAILASLHGPPPSFSAKMPASVKEEEEEVMGDGCGLVGSGSAWDCPAAVVTKLAAVYERVEMAKLDLQKEKMEIERKRMAFWNQIGAVKAENLEETDGD